MRKGRHQDCIVSFTETNNELKTILVNKTLRPTYRDVKVRGSRVKIY